jgi:tetratricopeptide (TPR) repeat protein
MQQPSLDEQIEAALSLHRAGQLDAAAKAYRHILLQYPEDIDALHLLGALMVQMGDAQGGLALIDKAIALDPNCAEFHNNRGLILAALEKVEEAIAAYRRAIEINPNFAEAQNNLGNALVKIDRLEEAQIAFRRALGLRPDDPSAHRNLGIVLHRQHRFDEAIIAYQAVLRLQPGFAEAHSNLGAALRKIGKTEQAVEAFLAAIAIDGTCVDAHTNLGAALHDLGRFDQAIAEYQTAISLNPDHFEAILNLGIALEAHGEPDQAIQAFRRALALQPRSYEAHLNLGHALNGLRDFDGAIAAFHQAITLKPDNPDAHFHLSGVLLRTGNFSDGWREYEWRLLKPEIRPAQSKYSNSQWTGQDLTGKRILLHCEQGAGDAIQFCRLCSCLTRRGAKTMLGCPPQLLRLFRTLDGVGQCITNVPSPAEYDYHCDLLSLPSLLGLRIDTIPANVPYLHPEPRLVEYWQNRLKPLGNRRKLGLVWAGSPTQANDNKRSIPLALFGPLAGLRDTAFVSLQKIGSPEQSSPPGLELADYSSELSDYADTAALIANLDLVISCDTSVAHLAGALGKPVWLLLRYIPAWRWLMDRDNSPWYPTMRLFRQTRPGDWETPIRAVADSLVSGDPFGNPKHAEFGSHR